MTRPHAINHIKRLLLQIGIGALCICVESLMHETLAQKLLDPEAPRRVWVHTGDSLSVIAQRHYEGSVYHRRHGSLLLLRQLNPQITDPDFVREGTWITLAEKHVPATSTREPASEDTPPPVVQTEPPPAATPAIPNPAPSPAPSSPLANNWDFWVPKARLGFVTIDSIDQSTGDRGLLSTRGTYGLGMEWTQPWSDHWSTNLFASVDWLEFNKPSNRDLVGQKTTSTQIGASLQHALSSRASFKTSLSSGERFFVRAPSTTSLQIVPVRVTQLAGTACLTVAKTDRLALDIELIGGYLLPASSDTVQAKSGYTYGAGLHIRRTQSGLDGILQLVTDSQSSTTTTRTQSQLLMSLGWKISSP